MNQELKFMSGLALRAGDIQIKHLGLVHNVEYKGPVDLVTEVDRACESYIVSEIRKKYPADGILAEEGSAGDSKSGRRWIIDPLDGTVNYAHGFPFFCVSIALEEGGDIAAGVICDPNRGELFTANKGEGAGMNGKRIAVSKTLGLKKALVATGFACLAYDEARIDDNLKRFATFVKSARTVRRPGSAAIDLAWTACGRIDGFWEMSLKPWDMAAGILIIREAGGVVTSFNGSPFDLSGNELLASNGLIHEEMIEVLK